MKPIGPQTNTRRQGAADIKQEDKTYNSYKETMPNTQEAVRLKMRYERNKAAHTMVFANGVRAGRRYIKRTQLGNKAS